MPNFMANQEGIMANKIFELVYIDHVYKPGFNFLNLFQYLYMFQYQI